MNIAYLILTHNQPSHVARLIKSLLCDGSYFFVHVDLKTDIDLFKELIPSSKNVIFLENAARIEVYWGGHSIVRATLNLLEAAMSSEVDFTWYCLLSGAHFPIKSNSQIKKALSISTETEFLRIDRKLDYQSNDGHSQFIKYFFLTDTNRRMMVTVPRKPYLKIPLYHGSQWWCLTDPCIRYIFKFLEENSDYIKFHEYVPSSDEIFFHSIIKSSPFAERIIHDVEKAISIEEYFNMNEHGCCYIDWSEKRAVLPHRLLLKDISDAELLIKSSALFARKFDENSSGDLLNKLEELIQE